MSAYKPKFAEEDDWSSIEDLNLLFERIYQEEEEPGPSDLWWHYSSRPWMLGFEAHVALCKVTVLDIDKPYFYHTDQGGHKLHYLDPHIHCESCSKPYICNFSDLKCNL